MHRSRMIRRSKEKRKENTGAGQKGETNDGRLNDPDVSSIISRVASARFGRIGLVVADDIGADARGGSVVIAHKDLQAI